LYWFEFYCSGWGAIDLCMYCVSMWDGSWSLNSVVWNRISGTFCCCFWILRRILFVSDSLAHLVVTSWSNVLQIYWINQNSAKMLLLFLNSWYNSVLMGSVKMSTLTTLTLERAYCSRYTTVWFLCICCWHSVGWNRIMIKFCRNVGILLLFLSS
jgi:hypothetical protein